MLIRIIIIYYILIINNKEGDSGLVWEKLESPNLFEWTD